MGSEMLAVLGAFLVSALALVRHNLTQQRASVDRVLGAFEKAVQIHDESNRRFALAIEGLSRELRNAIQHLHGNTGVST